MERLDRFRMHWFLLVCIVSYSVALQVRTQTRTTRTAVQQLDTKSPFSNQIIGSCSLVKANASRFTSLLLLSSSSQQQSASQDQQQSSLLPPAISIERLTCSHDGGNTYQLNDVSYVLQRGSKVALVGRNGAGKSTLLRILAENVADSIDVSRSRGELMNEVGKYSGKITCSRDVRVSFIEQEPPMYDDVIVADALLGMVTNPKSTSYNNNYETSSSNKHSHSVYSVVRQYRTAVQYADDNPNAFTTASAEMDRMNGWAVLTKCDEISTKLRVYHLYNQPLSKLSGGERKRVALAAGLIQEPDVLLLDEPTNYLSLAGVQWLANLLKGTSSSNNKMTILMVTHDRAFLDDVCDRILELDNGKLYEYTSTNEGTTFDDYLQAKADRLAVEDAAVQAAKAKYRVELGWMRRQPQARQTKSKSRIDAFYKLEKATKPRLRPAALQIHTDNDNDRRIGGKILSARNVNLQFTSTGKTILNDFSYDFCKGDRICLAGANGVGKTTFIRVLTGEIPPDSGIIEVGDTIVIGVYDQLGIQIDETNRHQTALEFVRQLCRSTTSTGGGEGSMDEARKLLQQFEFPKERWNERISILSGGERRRLQMLSVISERPNFLIMDEPSVDLDITTLQALEDWLCNDFTGVLLVVSHDRYFADKVTDHLFVFEGEGEIKDFQGTLSEYASALIELENSKAIEGSTSDTTSTTISNVGSSAGNNKDQSKEDKKKRNEQRNSARQAKKDIDNLEKQIDKLKAQALEIQKEIDRSADKGWSVLAELTDKLNSINHKMEEKEIQWMELAEQLEEAENEP